MIVIGLTGSIGMGKSVTATLFSEEGGGPVQSADAVVHDLYAAGGSGAAVIAEIAPETLAEDGSVDRERLRQRVQEQPGLLQQVEGSVHPLVRRERDRFLSAAEAGGSPFAILEIPLLFETGAERDVDIVVVASAPEAIQKERVLSRPGMDEPAFRALLAQQMPDSEKRFRADHVIDTGQGMESARAQVRQVLATVGIRPRAE